MPADGLVEILGALDAVRDLPYDDEPVDQLQHALQCAALARDAGSDCEVVVAALLHDVGRSPVVLAEVGSQADGDHGDLAARWLAPRVGERVAWLARQHVAAKRYLRAVDPGYPLTAASLRSLQAQGGPMGDAELAAFRAHPWWREAVALRRWDDAGKRAGLRVPGLPSYRPQLREVIAAHQRRSGSRRRRWAHATELRRSIIVRITSAAASTPQVASAGMSMMGSLKWCAVNGRRSVRRSQQTDRRP